LVKGWHTPLEGGGGAIVLLAQGDLPHSKQQMPRLNRVDKSL
jgi:hypothetical protein